MAAVNPYLALAAARYLCRHRSVGLLRMTLDLLRDPELSETWKKLGVDPAQALSGGHLLFKAVRIVQEHVEYLQQRGAADFIETAVYVFPNLMNVVRLPGINVANWTGKPCHRTVQAPLPAESSSSGS
jgi:hypothetical protein